MRQTVQLYFQLKNEPNKTDNSDHKRDRFGKETEVDAFEAN